MSCGLMSKMCMIKSNSTTNPLRQLKKKMEFPTPLGNELKFNPFMPNLDKSLPRISLEDPFITAINNIIDKELELTKINDEELKLIIGIVSARRIPD